MNQGRSERFEGGGGARSSASGEDEDDLDGEVVGG